MSETKSEKKWAHGDVVYVRAMVVSVCDGDHVLVGVRTDTGLRTTPSHVDIIAEPGALIDPDALGAEMVRPVAMEREERLAHERDALRAEVEYLKRGRDGAWAEHDAVRATALEIANERNDLRDDQARLIAENDALRAELTTTRDDLQCTAAAMWEPLRGVAAALGYPRAAAPDFGEVDEVPVREWAEVLKERRVAQQTASRELADVLRERLAALESQLNLRADERDRAESRLAIAERVIGRAAIDRAMETSEAEPLTTPQR